jgi:ribosome biogenesis GTPase
MSEVLIPLGWSDRWAALLGEHGPDATPARVLRHDGVAVQVATPDGERVVKLRRGVPPITVGDWLAIEGESVTALLERASLLRRRAAGGDDHQLLAANVDLVLLVCGLDRPVAAGRIQRGEALAWDAGAHPLLVLTKADLVDADEVEATVARVDEHHPGLEHVVVASPTNLGIDDLRARLAGHTSVLLGESGAGKSSLVNAVLDTEAAVVGEVRAGDRKGRHTTTNRQLHRLPGGGVIIDSPGIREVGLAGDEEAVDATFADIDELGEECHFADCGHAGEPGCAIALAIDAGELSPERLAAYLELRKEAASAVRRADEHARRTYERGFQKLVNEHVRQKPSKRQ